MCVSSFDQPEGSRNILRKREDVTGSYTFRKKAIPVGVRFEFSAGKVIKSAGSILTIIYEIADMRRMPLSINDI